ncbi:integrase domain-containing protein [Burkholderia stagnalis]|nr:integrase domain-containing protein [Burkholderia stagnalis]
MMRETFDQYLTAVAVIDIGVAVVLELQFELGLRAEERACGVKSLAR